MKKIYAQEFLIFIYDLKLKKKSIHRLIANTVTVLGKKTYETKIKAIEFI
jgi:hypothetical protein